MRNRIGLLTAWLLAVVTQLAAQDVPRRAVSDAGAGLYFGGTRSSLSGPVFYARRWVPLSGGHLFAGGRFEYRDDDDSRGRAVGVGVGFEVAPSARIGPLRLQLPLHVGLEYVRVSQVPPALYGLTPDATTGLHERVSFGMALALNTGSSELLFELRKSTGSAGQFTAGTFGIRGTPGGRGGGVHFSANTLAPITRGYQREADFLGYTLAYQWPLTNSVFDEIHGSLGIDFINFRSWSTGVISLLVGPAIEVARVPRVASLQVVPQAGFLKFVEGADNPLEYAAALGLEARLGPPAISGVVGASLLTSSGPEGLLAALQYRIGFGIGL